MNKDQLLMLMYAASRIKANSLEAGEEGQPTRMGRGGGQEGEAARNTHRETAMGGEVYPWGKKPPFS